MGRKYGLERYEDITLLPAEERRSRVHKNKAVLEAERQAKEAVAQSEYIAESNRLEAKHARERAAQYESYANAIDVKQEDLAIPSLETNQLVNDVWKFIQAELNTPPHSSIQSEGMARRSTKGNQADTHRYADCTLRCQGSTEERYPPLGTFFIQQGNEGSPNYRGAEQAPTP